MQATGKIVQRFEETGVVTNIERPVYHCFARSCENIAIVSESITEDPNVLIPHRSQVLGLSYGTLWRILHLDLHIHQYKLKPADHSQCRGYVQWVLKQQAVGDSNFSNKIFFSDESHFTLAGYVNKQNCSIWGSGNPRSN